MKGNFMLMLPGISLLAMILSACGIPARAGETEATNTIAPTEVLEPTTAPDVTPQTPVASHGGPVKDYVSLIDNLRAAGATVEPAGEIEQEFFSPTGYIIQVNGAEVQVFEFPDGEAAAADAALVAENGGSIGTTMVTWMATPHFYQADRVIVLYVGDDASVTALLESVLGPQFAGR